MVSSVVILSCFVLGQVEQPEAADLSAQVRKLVRQLDNDELTQRDEAEKQLVELGPQVLNHLPRVTSRTPAEVKVRLGRVVKALETKLVESSTQETLVTLDEEMTLADALDAMEQQTGNKVVGLDGTGPLIKAGFKDMPYWEALDNLLDQANLSINAYGGASNALTVVEAPEGILPRSDRGMYSGLFRIEPTQIDSRRDLRNPEMASLRLRIEVSWEPRLTPIAVVQDLTELEALDESGNSISAAGMGGMRGSQGRADISSIEIDLPLQLPDRGVKKIASLKGRLNVTLPGRIETFEFSDIHKAEDDEQRKAGVSVILEQVRKNVDLHELRVLVRFDESNNALETHRSWINNNDAFLVDAKGERVENLGFQLTKQDENEIGMGYLFSPEGELKDHKFVYRTPALIVQMPVNYELKDIDLP